MDQGRGVVAALLSSALGGSSIVATRFLAASCDPLTIGTVRFGIGCALLAPLAALGRSPWPRRGDWPGVIGLGVLFFGLFPVLFNGSLIYTTAARASLALATLPLVTMLLAAVFGVEALTWRKSVGVLLAMLGLAVALVGDAGRAPPGAWRGDALMLLAAVCMAAYNVWSRPLIDRSGALPFAVAGMAAGTLCLAPLAFWHGGLGALATLSPADDWALAYLGAFGGAATFFLWAYALGRTTPTRVAISIAVNPLVAMSLAAALLGEPVRVALLAGIAMVAAGIRLATSAPRTNASGHAPSPSPHLERGR